MLVSRHHITKFFFFIFTFFNRLFIFLLLFFSFTQLFQTFAYFSWSSKFNYPALVDYYGLVTLFYVPQLMSYQDHYLLFS